MNTNRQAQSSAHNLEEFFDVHTKGYGYLNRIREVVPNGRQRDKFLACDIKAIRGEKSAPSYTPYDLKVVGLEAQQLVRRLWADVDAKKKVLVAFKLGDEYPEVFEFPEYDPATRLPTGKMVWRASIKARLLQITHAKVDGVVVYSLYNEKDSEKQESELAEEVNGSDQSSGFDEEFHRSANAALVEQSSRSAVLQHHASRQHDTVPA